MSPRLDYVIFAHLVHMPGRAFYVPFAALSSKPGKGTTFRVLFPASGPVTPASRREPATTLRRGNGTILVVDDEELVRTLAQRMIKEAGFSVLTASGGQEAIRLFREHQHEVHCVLLDLTMPDRDGAETPHALRGIRPDVRVILSSCYNEAAATERFSEMRLVGFIQKPYQLDTLIGQLRGLLGIPTCGDPESKLGVRLIQAE